MNRRTIWGHVLAAAGLGAAPSVAVSAQSRDTSGTLEERVASLERDIETLYQTMLGHFNDKKSHATGGRSSGETADGDAITVSANPNPSNDPTAFRIECDIVRSRSFDSDNTYDYDYTLICRQ